MNKLISFVALATILTFGCSKENLDEQTNDEIKLITLIGSEKTAGEITLLEFSSAETYDATLIDLEAKLEAYDDEFLEKYGHLDEEALDDKEDEIGYNDQVPLIEFEKQFRFQNSMRQVFADAEEEWLNNEILDPETDPSNIYIFDNAEMAMLNENGEAKIGNSLLKLTNEGFVEFTDGDIDKLIRFNNGDMSVLDDPNVISSFDYQKVDGDCTWWKSKTVWDPYQTKRRVRKKVRFHAYPWKGTASSTITSFKRKRGRWKLKRVNLGVANQSFFRDNECTPTGGSYWSGWKNRWAKSISKRKSIWGAFPGIRAENGISIEGSYKYPSNINSLLLTW